MFKNIHKSAEESSKIFHEQTGNAVIVNSTSYFEFLNTYNNLIYEDKQPDIYEAVEPKVVPKIERQSVITKEIEKPAQVE